MITKQWIANYINMSEYHMDKILDWNCMLFVYNKNKAHENIYFDINSKLSN